MEDINDSKFSGNAAIPSNIPNLLDFTGNVEKQIMDTDGFEKVEVSENLLDFDNAFSVANDSPNFDVDQFLGMKSTTRPLLTTSDDDAANFGHCTGSVHDDPSDKQKIAGRSSPPSDYVDCSPKNQTTAPDVVGDALSISDEDTSGRFGKSESPTPVFYSSLSSHPTAGDTRHGPESEDLLPKSNIPKIDPKLVSDPKKKKEEPGSPAYEIIAQPQAEKQKTEVAMDPETSPSSTPAESNCPFSPGALLNPEKLHPMVAEYVYWRDVKKTGLVFGSCLVLLLSMTYFSLISVVAYIALAVLIVTISFRVYKNVLQAVQKKSNEGHPFKDYLEMDMNLSPETIRETTETLVHHANCVINKLRSLFMVEDLVDSLKLVLFLWCMTYVGAWFNGMTLVILALVSVFTLPKVYETNKTQIDRYMNLVCTQLNDVREKINAKIPLCKKKKEE